jgi:hypothetical protein
MSDSILPWETPEMKEIIEKFNGHVAEIKQIDIVVAGEINSGGDDRDIHG